MYDCYDKIIGLSNTDCVCTQENRPIDYNESTSGLYIDELSPIKGLVNMAECDKTVWTILEDARSLAIKKFVADSNALLQTTFSLKRAIAKNQFLGQKLAKTKYAVGDLEAQIVTRIRCASVRGGVMKIDKIGVAGTGAGGIGVQILDSFGTQHFLGAETFVAPYTTVDVNLELPLYSKFTPELEYYIITTAPSVEVYKTEIDCGCGGSTPTFNVANPHFNKIGSHPRAPWSDYIMIGGAHITGFTVADNSEIAVSKQMYGVGIEADFYCKVGDVLCSESLDFQANPLALSLAFAIQYQAAIQVGESMLKSTLLNRENMMNHDLWEDSIVLWQEKYSQNVNYIVQNVDHTANDCLTCKDILGLTRQGLFS